MPFFKKQETPKNVFANFYFERAWCRAKVFGHIRMEKKLELEIQIIN